MEYVHEHGPRCLFPLLCGGFAPADGSFRSRADRAFHGDVQQSRFAGSERAFQRGLEVVRTLDELAVAAETLHYLFVAALAEICADGAAVKAELNLPVDAPRRIVADDRDD